ncbi:MAG: PDZ domain-containing protein [Acidobacteria bacterium]|nr:PDZ domain-containing protein [Acidobacteriota bacterium]MCA1642378.1 PDZ domain-containing protein [Acidobacteriota bacterium]
MRTRRRTPLALAALLLLTLCPAQARPRPRQGGATPARAQTPAPQISYTVSMPEPHTHLLQVQMSVTGVSGAALPPQLDLVMPVWTPGSYLVREFERHVQDFRAVTDVDHRRAWRKVNKNTWRVETSGARTLRVGYAVYANEFSVRTNELNDRHAFWNNAPTLMYPDGFLGAPSTVRVEPHGDWKIATGLPAVSGERDTFRAENYDVLYDSPFLVSDFKVLPFEVRGVPHRVVIDGEGNYDAERLRRDVQKIVEAAVGVVGEIPYRDYTFLLMLHPTAGGGLEHLNSTALIFRRFNFRPDTEYRNLLTLVAHEFFHAWNVKRIRPDALGPFDYTGENYTRLLWVAEGVTSYYENLIARRAGLMTEKEYLDDLARSVRALQNTPGRLEVSLEESSFDAWIKYYRADENSINSTVSYYDKGAIVGLLLDLEIRRRSAGAKSLDDVMRHLYAEFFKKQRNYTPEDFQRAAELMAGGSLEDFFGRFVRGREELDYNAALAGLGLQLEAFAGDRARPAAERAYFGATLAQAADRLNVTNVLSGSPAYAQGLNAGDQIVAVDGARATLDFLNARLNDKKPGDEVRLAVFRTDELRNLTVKLGARPDNGLRVVPVKAPTPEQARLYEQWMLAPLRK